MVRPAYPAAIIANAIDPRCFGRRKPFTWPGRSDGKSFAQSDDMRLFATTFAAGFLVVSVLIA